MIPAALRTRLLTNGRKTAAGKAIDPFPVVKVFAPDGYATWLLTEIDPDDLDHTFGLCDPGLGSLNWAMSACRNWAACRTRFGLLLEIDRHFHARMPLSEYAAETRILGRIVA